MTQVFHVVGVQGSGKSTVIRLMAEGFAAAGRKCAGADPEIFEDRAGALAAHPDADVVFIEALRLESVKAERGDTVIQIMVTPGR